MNTYLRNSLRQPKKNKIKKRSIKIKTIKTKTLKGGNNKNNRNNTNYKNQEGGRDVQEFILTTDDINFLFGKKDNTGFPPHYLIDNPVRTKIRLAAINLRELHNDTNIVDATKFPNVICTSDIHGDYVQFIENLYHNKLILLDNSNYYSPEFIANIKWNPEVRDTLFVICGDIVDGARRINGQKVNVLVENDSNELWIMCLIYNLRLSARKYNSEILFTIGNHDLISMIRNEDNEYNNYISDKTIDFFNKNNITKDGKINYKENELRAHYIALFYLCSPNLYILVSNNNQRNIICLHAGLLEKNREENTIVNYYESLEKEQRLLEDKFTTEDLIDALRDMYDKKDSYPVNTLFTRYYAENPQNEVCQKIKEGEIFDTIVVGHCPTNFSSLHHREIINSSSIYNDCKNNGGCVLLGCNNFRVPNYKDDDPIIAFVDVTMSSAFGEFQGRWHEMLKLESTRDETNKNIRPYYNVISRLRFGRKEPLKVS
jgi:hypothetical protein